jgi:hypothetical protein
LQIADGRIAYLNPVNPQSAFHFPLPLNSRLPAANIAAAFNHSTFREAVARFRQSRGLYFISLSAKARNP